MTTDNKYNGWTNYATWRINLEMFDGLSLGDFWGFSDDEPSTLEAYELGEVLKSYAEESLEEYAEGIALGYALAFLSDVNWSEIASHLIENSED